MIYFMVTSCKTKYLYVHNHIKLGNEFCSLWRRYWHLYLSAANRIVLHPTLTSLSSDLMKRSNSFTICVLFSWFVSSNWTYPRNYEIGTWPSALSLEQNKLELPSIICIGVWLRVCFYKPWGSYVQYSASTECFTNNFSSPSNILHVFHCLASTVDFCSRPA